MSGPTPIAPDVPSTDTFGGALVDTDAVEDPQSELSALYWNRLIAQVAALSAVAPKALVLVSGSASILWWRAQWDPLATPPTATLVSGVYTITFPTTVNDLQTPPEVHTLGFVAAKGTAHEPSAGLFVDIISVGANTVSFGVYGAASPGTHQTPTSALIEIF